MANELSAEQQFCLEGCRSYEQYAQMRRSFELGRCVFCDLDRTLNEVLWEDEWVYAWSVPKAFLRATLHYHGLFVPKRHVRFEIELSPEEVLSLHEAKRVLHTKFQYEGGLTHVREGDMAMNAGTVPHLHYNTIMPNRTSEVRVAVYKDAQDRDAQRARVSRWGRRYLASSDPLARGQL